MTNNIRLIGFMGVGKGSVAREIVRQSGIIAIDTDDPGIEYQSNSIDFFKSGWEVFIFAIDNPDGLVCDTIKIPIRGSFPGGIYIDSIGIMTSTETTYQVDFEEWTDIDHSSGSESSIENTILTSAPVAISFSNDDVEPGTLIRSPKVVIITSSRRLYAMA